MNIYMCICNDVYTFVCVYICVWVCVWACVCVHKYKNTTSYRSSSSQIPNEIESREQVLRSEDQGSTTWRLKEADRIRVEASGTVWSDRVVSDIYSTLHMQWAERSFVFPFARILFGGQVIRAGPACSSLERSLHVGAPAVLPARAPGSGRGGAARWALRGVTHGYF